MSGSEITKFILIISVFMSLSCESVSEIPAKGFVGPYEVETTVDHEIAKIYLADIANESKRTKVYEAMIRQIELTYEKIIPDVSQLKSISEETSVDFATIFYCRKLLDQLKNRWIQKKFITYLNSVRTGQHHHDKYSNLSVILVPGFDYVATGSQTGADLSVPRRILSDSGVEVHFANINPLGTVAENALFVSQMILDIKHSKDLIIAGPSSAGPAIHLALSNLLSSEESKQVKAWLNLGGIIGGSAVLEWIDSGFSSLIWSLILWHQGWRAESFDGLKTSVAKSRLNRFRLPVHIKVVNYLGLSLSGQISEYGKDKYLIMRSMGPNDGLALLPDMVYDDGYTILAPESDHFFARDPMIDLKTLALLDVMVDLGSK